MSHPITLALAILFGLTSILRTGFAQAPAPTATAANTITTSANGVTITFSPGAAPALTANTAGTSTAPGLAIAASATIRYIDKHGKDVDPKTIRPGERLQPLWDSGPNGPIVTRVMVDRD